MMLVGAYSIFAISNSLYEISINYDWANKIWWVKHSLDFISLLILIYTLSHIAEIQLRYQILNDESDDNDYIYSP